MSSGNFGNTYVDINVAISEQIWCRFIPSGKVRSFLILESKYLCGFGTSELCCGLTADGTSIQSSSDRSV